MNQGQQPCQGKKGHCVPLHPHLLQPPSLTLTLLFAAPPPVTLVLVGAPGGVTQSPYVCVCVCNCDGLKLWQKTSSPPLPGHRDVWGWGGLVGGGCSSGGEQGG